MRKWLLLCLLSIPLAGQQINTDVIPASPGLNLGRSNQPWNIFANNLTITGSCLLNNAPCFGAASAAAPSLSLQGNLSGRLTAIPNSSFNSSTGALTLNALNIIPNANINGIFAADGTLVTLAQAVAKCPSSSAGCHIYVTKSQTFTSGLVFSQASSPITIECVNGSDQNGGGTVLTFAPSIANQSAVTVQNGSRFSFRNCVLKQSGGQANTDGIVMQGSQGGVIDSSMITGFTGTGWLITDSASSSGIYNSCLNSRIFNNGGPQLWLQQTHTNEVVNQNSAHQCSFEVNTVGSSTSPSIKVTGNASENAFYDVDVSNTGSSQPPVIVQLGDNTNFCRDNNFYDGTMETTGTLANQVGFQNNCQSTFVHSEGGLTGSGAISIQDGTIGSACHWYQQGSGANSHGVGGDSTCPYSYKAGTLSLAGAGNNCAGFVSGVLTAGSNCGTGGGVSPGTIHQVAEYPSTGSNVSGSSGLTENGTTLNYNANFSVAGPRPWIDVTGPGYGADPTGVADSTTALNKAFTNCSGGTVYLPPNTGGGFYKHTGQLTISTAGCTIQSFAQGAVIKKSYNSTGGFPGSNGSFVITGSNTIIDGIAYDGNNGSFTGPCITFSTAATQVIFQNNYVHNCDGNSLTFTGLNSGATGPSNFRVLNNTIIGGANGFPLQFSQDIEYFDIENNTFDGSAITLSGSGGPATLQLESQGLTTQISHGIIAHNTLISPNCSTGECWTVQLGQFNGYASTDIIYGPNLTLLSGNIANCGSFQGVRDSRFDLGVCESNTGVSDAQNYTMWEFILDNNIDITGGTINGEGPGNSEGIIFSSTSNSTLSGVTINGFGESSTSGVTAGLEVSAAAAGAVQAITSCSESGNIATYTVTTPPLQAAWQPPATVYFGGSYTPSGYGGGPYTVINTNYNRISGTFSVVLPVTGLGNCTGTGTVQTGSWNNTFSGITINFPVGIYGSLTSTLYGIQERCTLAGGCYTSDNHFSGITINGTPGTSVTETGISIQGTGTADSNTFTDIQLNNLTNGIASTVGTNNNIIKPRFVNVGTHVSGTTGLYIDYMAPNAVPTITGCGTVTSQLGNGFSGSFNAASGTCTVVITPGETAINGFRCSAADITTPADTFTQTAKSTTTCTLTGTVTSGDLIQFSAAAY
jgi:hypothetical protein